MVEFYGNKLDGIPEVLVARRVAKVYGLRFPFDLRSFAESILDVVYLNIPIKDVDGVVLNLKTPGKNAKILINSSVPFVRQNFTLAHELGHFFIPWHIGTIGDSVHADYNADFEYAEMEIEANRFAVELLMPTDWVESLFNSRDSISDIHKEIVLKADVSALAAALKILDLLPPNYLFVETDENGVVNMSKASNGSIVRLPRQGDIYSHSSFQLVDSYCKYHSKYTVYHWLNIKMEAPIVLGTEDNDWRKVLNFIVSDAGLPFQKQKSAVQAANGVIGNLYGRYKKGGGCTQEHFKAACMSRFSNLSHCN